MPKNLPKINSIAQFSRRLDSIAWLIQGDDVCGAASFDGKNILLATNETQKSFLIEKIEEYLYTVADKSRHIKKGIFDAKGVLNKEYKKKKIFFNKKMEEIKAYASTSIDLYKTNSDYREAFNRALKKITYSILYTYVLPRSPRSLTKEFCDALLNKRFIFINDKNAGNSQNARAVHAELKILQRFIDTNSFNQYIGISKKCCRNCENTIKAYNLVSNFNSEAQEIKFRGYDIETYNYRKSFPASVPEFLAKNPKIKQAFLKLVERSNLIEAFNESHNVSSHEQLHIDSSSEAEHTDVEIKEILFATTDNISASNPANDIDSGSNDFLNEQLLNEVNSGIKILEKDLPNLTITDSHGFTQTENEFGPFQLFNSESMINSAHDGFTSKNKLLKFGMFSHQHVVEQNPLETNCRTNLTENDQVEFETTSIISN